MLANRTHSFVSKHTYALLGGPLCNRSTDTREDKTKVTLFSINTDTTHESFNNSLPKVRRKEERKKRREKEGDARKINKQTFPNFIELFENVIQAKKFESNLIRSSKLLLHYF